METVENALVLRQNQIYSRSEGWHHVCIERVTTSSGHNIYRISVAGYKDFCISPNSACTEGFLLVLYRITFVFQDLLSRPTCLDLPRLA